MTSYTHEITPRIRPLATHVCLSWIHQEIDEIAEKLIPAIPRFRLSMNFGDCRHVATRANVYTVYVPKELHDISLQIYEIDLLYQLLHYDICYAYICDVLDTMELNLLSHHYLY